MLLEESLEKHGLNKEFLIKCNKNLSCDYNDSTEIGVTRGNVYRSICFDEYSVFIYDDFSIQEYGHHHDMIMYDTVFSIADEEEKYFELI